MSGVSKDFVENYIRALYEKSSPLTKSMEEYARLHEVPVIEKESLELLKLTVKLCSPKKILELGTAIGYSAICMAMLDRDISVTSIDIDDVVQKKAKQFIAAFGLQERIRLIHGDASEMIESLEGGYDFVFIDAGKSHYLEYIKLLMPHINDGAVIFSDNVLFKGLIANDELVNRRARTLVRGMREYLDILTSTDGMMTSVVPIGDGVAITLIENKKRVEKALADL